MVLSTLKHQPQQHPPAPLVSTFSTERDMSHLVSVAATAAPDAGPDVGKQTTLTPARLDERLRAERSSLADAVVMTVYIRRASDFAAMNDAYRLAERG